MGESIPFGDLIVLGAVALFIILRYRSVLGQKTGHDVSKPSAKPKNKGHLQIVATEPEDTPVEVEADETFDNPEIADAMRKMKAIDHRFSVQEFLGGAKVAFEMILDAFNQHDRETLKMLLANDVYESFESNLKEQQEKGTKAETTLVALKSADIVEAEVKKNTAVITVQFVSEQVHVVKDKDGKVVEGDASLVQDIADEWTLERDLKSSNPNWTITAT